MLNVENFIQDRYPDFIQRYPKLSRPIIRVLRMLFKEKAFQQFQHDYPHLTGFEFVEQVLDYFDFRYTVRDDQRPRIPASGRVVIIANHPIGSLDGLALLKLVRETRHDAKVVANELLHTLVPLHNVLLPVNNMGGNTPRQNFTAIREHLDREGALIIFPAGEVSRLSPKGVQDSKWHSGFLRMAIDAKAPILPIFVDGRNSALFYSVSLIAKPLSTLLLVREMFKQAKNCVDIRIGELISYNNYQRINVPIKLKTKLFKRHLYRMGQDKSLVFNTETAIAYPENRALLRDEIKRCEPLGKTGDGKLIYLYRYQANSLIMREIGRLREISFRAAGEGTGFRRDIDRYDQYYFHLLLWDENELEIVGAYRFCDATRCADDTGDNHLYSNELFRYTEAMKPYFEQGLELGRSFVQPKYWGRRSLDYLWYGIGAFLRKNPQYRYLFGPVTLSDSYSQWAMEMLVHYYNIHYPCGEKLASPILPYTIRDERATELMTKFPGKDPKTEFVELKSELAHMNLNVPTLYKQYTEICEPGGVQFAGFNVDPHFSNCVDGLIIVDLTKLKPSKHQRYIG
ncbi:MAG: lysophospholipid acyltransferase family protein [Pseudomonadales bacterium]|nr:lysophospholipid acyltransferase family protein [Pseudomonadales bacterium]MCP5172033.1 GNAT family N-acetyltransferase [Pseudomonadales bacterium]